MLKYMIKRPKYSTHKRRLSLRGLALAIAICIGISIHANRAEHISIQSITGGGIALPADSATTKKPKKAENNEQITMKQRWGFKTNAIDWMLTIPNMGVEFDLRDNVRNKHTVNLNLKWNWDTRHKYVPPTVFNVLDVRGECRQYFRTRQRGLVTPNPDFKTRLKERILTTKRQNPNPTRAYYWGIYAQGGNFSIKLGDEGKQGTHFGAGVSLGFTQPLYGYSNGYIDLEMGGAVGLVYAGYDTYSHCAESNDYAPIETGKAIVLPMITDLRIAFVWRYMSMRDKYKPSIERRIDRIMDRRNKLNEKINLMRVRIDSISSAERRKGNAQIDSLLTKEELKQWRKMQEEQAETARQDAEKKLRQQVADSLGIVISDSLSKDQQRELDRAVEQKQEMQQRAAKLLREQQKLAAEPMDSAKAAKLAAKEEERARKEAEKLAKKQAKEAEKAEKAKQKELEKAEKAKKKDDDAPAAEATKEEEEQP